MPTTRPRHVVTETDTVARAIDDAAKRWPEETRRGRLLLRLIEEGHGAIDGRVTDQRARRHDAIEQASGIFTGMYEEGYLKRLREDWPA